MKIFNKFVLYVGITNFTFLSPKIFTQGTVNIGFQGGINRSTISTIKTYAPIELRLGYMVGLVSEFKFSDNFFIRPELNYIEKGAKVVGLIIGDDEIRSTYILNYISLPINFEFYFANLNESKFYIFMGPNISFNIVSEMEETITQREYAKTRNYPIDNCGALEYSLDIGIGFAQRMGQTTSFFVNARYSHGINDINKDVNESWKSRSVQLFGGIKLGL